MLRCKIGGEHHTVAYMVPQAEALEAGEAARLFESAVAGAVVGEDGTLSLSALATSAAHGLMPKLQTQGRLGQARWRLVSAPSIPGALLCWERDIWIGPSPPMAQALQILAPGSVIIWCFQRPCPLYIQIVLVKTLIFLHERSP